MMKALKLLLIFLAIAGGLFVALNWQSIVPSSQNEGDFGEEDLIDISEKCEEIREAWKRAAGWDESLYKVQRADINQSKELGMFSREGYNTVNNTLRESATNKACESYLVCLHDTAFDASKMQHQYDGVQFLKEHEQLKEDDPRVKEVEERHALYRKIVVFVKSSHTISPQFDPDEAAWTSFAVKQNHILGTARSYRNNKLYQAEMTHIPGFRHGLSESHVSSVTNAQRSGFYEDLSSQIIHHFETDSLCQENSDRLNEVYNMFVNQESNHGVERLAAFVVNYKDQLEQLLKANEQTIQL